MLISFLWGGFVRGVFGKGVFCPGGFVRGFMSWGFCLVGFVLIPMFTAETLRKIPRKISVYFLDRKGLLSKLL